MTIAGLKILVIDDSSVVLKITVQLLQDAGHEAEGLNRPEEALDRVRQLQPDMVVCDIMMPGVNGLEVLRLIREEEDLAQAYAELEAEKLAENDDKLINRARRLVAEKTGEVLKVLSKS